ncbi:MAG: Trm112 family protein [Pseudomonadota bacterium]
MDERLLDILVCPLCKGRIIYDREKQTLTCRADRLVFPIKNNIPIMLLSEAQELNDEALTT